MSGDRPIGLIAGQGDLPLIVAEGMREAGRRVCCVGLREQFDDRLPALCDEFASAGIIQLGRWIRLLKRFGVTDAVMVGRVAKTRMHDPLKLFRQLPDWRAIDLWYRRLRHDRRNAVLLAALADELAGRGINLVDCTAYIPDHLATEGVMTKTKTSAAAEQDLTFGWSLLQRMVNLDIGQSLAVRDRDIIAVEAVEGTDRMIDRAGELCRSRGWTLLKTARANHDMRADVPTIGVGTIERMASAGGRCLAVGAGRVILINKTEVIAAADAASICIVGMV